MEKTLFFNLVEPFPLVKPSELLSFENSSLGLTPTVRQLDVGQGDLARRQRYPF